jgi:hypothetical protein
MIYCYPKLGRQGLGNCLLPWARAVIAARELSAAVLAPRWVQPRLGALIRRERKKRFYVSEFSNAGYIKGLRKYAILLGARRIEESAASLAELAEYGYRGPSVVIFEGLKNYFSDIISHRTVLLQELRRIVNRHSIEKADAAHVPFIAVNIRRGDLTNAGWSAERLMKEPRFTPTGWFVDAINALRQDCRWANLPIKVVSDGTEAELQDVIRLLGCELASTNSAVGDIIMMSRARMLVASGHSTFSMWASYLGQMPTLYYPGKMQQKVFPPGCHAFEGEWSIGQPLPCPVT